MEKPKNKAENFKNGREKSLTVRQEQMALKKEILLENLEQSMGIISQAVKKVGMSRQTVYKWMKDDPEFKEKVDEILNVTLDFAESKLLEEISNNNISAIIFYLKTKGKNRGYVERIEAGFRIEQPLFPEPDGYDMDIQDAEEV